MIDEKCSKTLGTSFSGLTWLDKFDELGDTNTFDFLACFPTNLVLHLLKTLKVLPSVFQVG